MVTMPPETTFDTDEPDTKLLRHDDTTETFAGPPRRWPSSASDSWSMKLPAPAMSSIVPNITNRNTNAAETPSATPYTPSVVSQKCEPKPDPEAPLCNTASGMYGPANTYSRKSPVVMSMLKPIARRVASSITTTPTPPATRSNGVGLPGRVASWL